MVKHLKFIALTLVCSTAAYAVGLSWQGAARAPVYAAKGGDFHDTCTPIQMGLLSYISHTGNELMEGVEDPKVCERVILAMNYATMAVLNPAQQQANLAWIQIDAYKPGPGTWDRVRKAPTMVDAILKVSPEQSKQFAKWAAADEERRRNQWKFLEGLPRDEAIRRQREELAKKTRAQHRAEWSARLNKEFAQIRSILNREQRNEWDEMIALTDREYRKAMGR